MRSISSLEWIQSLVELKSRLNIPEDVLENALKDNPWFTPYYIKSALEGIKKWMDEEKLKEFVERYEVVEEWGDKKEVGIIAAGNIPLVGFHDLVCGILSGHKLSLKLSHQDKVMMKWLANEWINVIPELKSYLRLDGNLNNIDFLIATGSDNTSRYFEANFKHIPKVIRKNRFSVAIIDSQTTDNELGYLCEDMLLYSGLGCRNVSNIILLDGKTLDPLRKKIEKYPISKVNLNYLERILFESTRKGVLNKEFITSKFGLFSFGSILRPLDMGYFQVIEARDREEASRLIKAKEDQIQVVVGEEIPFGTSQSPKIEDFADGVDTMKILTESRKK